MGGINCGNSNGRVIKNDSYRLEYAFYSKSLFKCLENFYSANAWVEEFTLLEITDTEKALFAYEEALRNFCEAMTHLEFAKKSLLNCYNEIAPFFRFSRLRNGAVNQYKKFNESFAKDLFEKERIVTNETKVWKDVISSLKNGGEVDYLLYQQEELVNLEKVLKNLFTEYQKLEKDVRQGVSHVSIRDIDVDVTPLTAMALTKINDLISSLTYLCLVEYSAHTSVSGKTVEVFDLLPKSNDNLTNYQKVN